MRFVRLFLFAFFVTMLTQAETQGQGDFYWSTAGLNEGSVNTDLFLLDMQVLAGNKFAKPMPERRIPP